MKTLLDTGILTKIKFGVKLLGKGSENLTALSTSMNASIEIEVTDATQGAIEAI